MTHTPAWVVPGGQLRIDGSPLPVGPAGPPQVNVGSLEARVLSASPRHLRIAIPAAAEGGAMPITIEPGSLDGGVVEVARTLATGVHLVDSPAFDGLGRLYITHSGGRGVRVPVPIYRVRADGGRDPVAVELPNPTSLALGPDGAMYVSSRFEGQVYRLTEDDRVELYVAELGVPTGLAFGPDGSMFVGDRSGSVFRVSRDKKVDTFATLPASVAAFHLAFGPDGCLYVAAPTLSSHDVIYRITPDRLVETLCDGLGRPQGLAFDSLGHLYVAEALAGASGLVRIDVRAEHPVPELVATAPSLVGVAFDPSGGLVVCSNDTVWRFDVPLTPGVPGSSSSV